MSRKRSTIGKVRFYSIFLSGCAPVSGRPIHRSSLEGNIQIQFEGAQVLRETVFLFLTAVIQYSRVCGKPLHTMRDEYVWASCQRKGAFIVVAQFEGSFYWCKQPFSGSFWRWRQTNCVKPIAPTQPRCKLVSRILWQRPNPHAQHDVEHYSSVIACHSSWRWIDANEGFEEFVHGVTLLPHSPIDTLAFCNNKHSVPYWAHIWTEGMKYVVYPCYELPDALFAV